MTSARTGSAPDGVMLSQAQAAQRASVSVTQIRNWHAAGVLAPRASEPRGRRTRHLYAECDVDAAKAWAADLMWENEVVMTLRVTAEHLPRLTDLGRVPQPRMYGSRRVYSRAAVTLEWHRRQRLISQREVSRQFDLPYWVLRSWVADGLLPYESGAKGAYLIDPHDLKPLLDCRPCRVCGGLLRPGRKVHAHCHPQTLEARQRISEVKKEFFSSSANRWNISVKRRAWWSSEAASLFRARLVTMPCPECGDALTRREREVHRDRIFCGNACAMRWRWRTGEGMEKLIDAMPGRVRQRYKGRWAGPKGKDHGIKGRAHGVKGRAHGIESRFSNVGRPPASSPEQKQQVLALDKRGMSQRDIAQIVYGDKNFRDRVRRILNG